MRSNSQPAAPNYLYRVLLDGAMPFRYRGGVYSLLGIPNPGAGGIFHAAHVPPVGFAYAKGHADAMPLPDEPLPPTMALEAAPERAEGRAATPIVLRDEAPADPDLSEPVETQPPAVMT